MTKTQGWILIVLTAITTLIVVSWTVLFLVGLYSISDAIDNPTPEPSISVSIPEPSFS